MVNLDRTDQRILALLSKNARMSNKELAAAVDLAPSSVHERTKRLFETGIVAGAHADVSLERVGLAIKAMLLIQLSEHEKGNLKRFLEEISHIPEVRAAWMITGRFDTVVELVTRDTRHLHRVVVEQFSSREEIHRIETSIVFESIKQQDLSQTLALAEQGG